MIKFAGKHAEGQFVGLGLTAENLRRLQAHEPIQFGMDIDGIKVVFMIFYGESEHAMYEELKDLIGPDTHVEGELPV